MKQHCIRLCAALLAVSLLAGLLPAAAASALEDTPEFQETVPEETPAPETLPAETSAPETVSTEPPPTLPAETVPAETLPAETIPAETLPAETQPAETEPEPTQTQPADPEPPLVTAFPVNGLLSPGDTITLYCSQPDAAIYYAMSGSEEDFPDFRLYDGPIEPPELGSLVYLRCYARAEGAAPGPITEMCFSLPEILSAQPQNPVQNLPQSAPSQNRGFYFGLLHSHAGSRTPAALYAAAKDAGLDFFALTELSVHFENHPDAWSQGTAAAASARTDAFLPLFAFEFEWLGNAHYGHMTTFAAEAPIFHDKNVHDTPEGYYQSLPEGSFSQFNHPAERGNFENFAYDPRYDGSIPLLELEILDGSLDTRLYTAALNQGWHVAPTVSPENPYDALSASLRTVVLAKALTEDAFREAIENRRVYASMDADLEIDFRSDAGPMGSILSQRPGLLTVTVRDPSDPEPSGTVEVLGRSGQVLPPAAYSGQNTTLDLAIPLGDASEYYFLKITQADGDTAVTAPIWIRETYTDFGVSALTAANTKPAAGEMVTVNASLYNNEPRDLVITALSQACTGVTLPFTVPAFRSVSLSFPVTREDAGAVECVLTAKGTLGQQEVTITSEPLTLHFQPPAAPERTDIRKVRRQTALGKTVLVASYVTAGTDNPHTRFPDTIYLQDDSGGIAVTGYPDTDLKTGTYVEIQGILTQQDGNYTLTYLDRRFPNKAAKKIDPDTAFHHIITDYAAHGGELMQAQGTVVTRTLTADGKGVARLTLRDSMGDCLTVLIEESILSGTYGTNELSRQIRPGRTVRVRGLVHMHQGDTVLRVRNCDEVVDIPPKPAVPDKTNPKTGEARLFPPVRSLLLCFSAALPLCIRRKRRIR